MERICQSPLTPRTLSTHLLARLLASGKEDMAVQLMHRKCRVQRLPNKLSLPHQTLLLIFNAKEAICTRHRTAVAKLRDPTFLHTEIGWFVKAYYRYTLSQSTKMDMEATMYHWPSLSVFEVSGALGELLWKTLESIFSFTDAFSMHLCTIINTENIQLENIKPSAITCNMAFDNFIEALTDIYRMELWWKSGCIESQETERLSNWNPCSVSLQIHSWSVWRATLRKECWRSWGGGKAGHLHHRFRHVYVLVQHSHVELDAHHHPNGSFLQTRPDELLWRHHHCGSRPPRGYC